MRVRYVPFLLAALFWSPFLEVCRCDEPPSPVFRAEFDGKLDADSSRGKPGAESSGPVKFEKGVKGKAVVISEGVLCRYAAEGNFNRNQGTIEMWIRPDWDAGDGKRHWLFTDDKGRFKIFKYANGNLYFQLQDDSKGYNCSTPCRWRAGEWHHVAAVWRNINSGKADAELALYVDGVLEKLVVEKLGVSVPPAYFFIGTNRDGTEPADAAIDGLRIYDRPVRVFEHVFEVLPLPQPRDVAYSGLGAHVKTNSEIKWFHGKAYIAQFVIDGRLSGNYWCTNFPAGDKPPYWLEVDFGRRRTFDEVRLYMKPGREMTTYRIQIPDGGGWKDIVSVSPQDARENDATLKFRSRPAVAIHRFEPVESDRIRLVFPAGVVRLHELQVLKPAVTRAASEPVPLGKLGPVYRFDFGPAFSPSRKGCARISENTAYRKELGYGWVSRDDIIAVDRDEPFDMAQTFLAGCRADGRPTSNRLRIDVPAGVYFLTLFSCDWDYPVTSFDVAVGGSRIAAGIATSAPGGWALRTFRVELRQGPMEIEFAGKPDWVVNGLFLSPAPEFDGVVAELNELEYLAALGPKSIWRTFTRRDPPAEVALRPTNEEREKGYVLFTRPYTQRVYPTSVPRREEVCTRVETFASPGEYEPVTVSVYPLRPLTGMRLDIGDLHSDHGNIPRDNIDIRLVRCWPQLVKDGAKTRQYMVIPELLERPDMLGDVFTPAGCARQYWITVRVPDDAKPGKYSGDITFSARGVPPSRVRFVLEVLPVKLTFGPVEAAFIYWRHTGADEKRLRAQLRDIREHGMNGVALGMPKETVVEKEGNISLDYAPLKRLLKLVKDAGLTAPMPLYVPCTTTWAETPEGADRIRAFVAGVQRTTREVGGPEILFYPVDEPFGNKDRLDALRRTLPVIKSVPGARTYCTVHQSDVEAIDEWLDVRCYALGVPDDFQELRADSTRDGKVMWWYTNACREYPDVRRYIAGVWFWKTGATGHTYWHYQSIRPGVHPFQDLTGDTVHGTHATAYPGINGPVPTIEWECIREGLDDARYLYTLEAAIKDAEKNGPKERKETARKARAFLEQLRGDITNGTVYDGDKKIYYECPWRPAKLDRCRAAVKDYLKKLVPPPPISG